MDFMAIMQLWSSFVTIMARPLAILPIRPQMSTKATSERALVKWVLMHDLKSYSAMEQLTPSKGILDDPVNIPRGLTSIGDTFSYVHFQTYYIGKGLRNPI